MCAIHPDVLEPARAQPDHEAVDDTAEWATQSLLRTASWVIRERATQRVLFETFNPAIPAALNVDRYEAVPILEYLQSLNR